MKSKKVKRYIVEVKLPSQIDPSIQEDFGKQLKRWVKLLLETNGTIRFEMFPDIETRDRYIGDAPAIKKCSICLENTCPNACIREVDFTPEIQAYYVSVDVEGDSSLFDGTGLFYPRCIMRKQDDASSIRIVGLDYIMGKVKRDELQNRIKNSHRK